MMARLTSGQAAAQIIGLLSTPVLPEFTGDVGLWLSDATDENGRLSSGERILVSIVRMFWAGYSDVRISDIGSLDRVCQVIVLDTLTGFWGAR